MPREPKPKPDFPKPHISSLYSKKKCTMKYSEKEEEVMKHLVEAWNAFVAMYDSYTTDELDKKSCHPDDVEEFRHGIHTLQHILAARAMRRIDPKNWLHYPLMVKSMFHEL